MVFASAANVIAWLAKRVPGIRESKENGGDNSNNEDCAFTHIHIYYGSQTGRCKRYAHQLAATPQFSSKCTVHNLSEFEPERLLKPTAIPTHLHLFIMSTYQDGTAPDNAKWFFSWLEDFRYDFRVEKDWLSGMRYAVFGAGNSVYGSLNYNRVAKQVDLWLNGLAAKRIWPLTLADEDLQGCF
jgi:tRNA wybutosine-synthesizing protein 1